MTVSGLSDWEYVSIVGHYNKLNQKPSVDPKLLARGYTEDQLAELEKRLGKTPGEWMSLNLHFKVRSERFDYPLFNYVISLFNQYHKNGVLPYSGPLADQPAKIIEIFEVLEQLQYEREEQIRKDHERQAKRQERRSR